MTNKELNDMKRRHNTLQAEGQALHEKLTEMGEKLVALRKQIEAEEGDDYDPIPLIFGAGFYVDDDGH